MDALLEEMHVQVRRQHRAFGFMLLFTRAVHSSYALTLVFVTLILACFFQASHAQNLTYHPAVCCLQPLNSSMQHLHAGNMGMR